MIVTSPYSRTFKMPGSEASSSVTSSLVKALLAAEDRIVRPGSDHGPATVVTAGISAYDFEEVKCSEGVFTVHGALELSWNNPRLKWDPKSYDNITKVFLPSCSVWLPDIALFNKADATSKLFNPEFQVAVLSNGDCLWFPPAAYSVRSSSTSGKEIKVHLVIGSWVCGLNELDIKSKQDKMDLAYFMSSRFKVINSSVTRNEEIYPSTPPLTFSVLNVEVEVQRTA